MQTKKPICKEYYEVNDVCSYLSKIYNLYPNILSELYNQATTVSGHNDWILWPEKELYDINSTWKILPFYAFGTWVNSNCAKFPTIYEFIKHIPNLKLATLSKLGGKTKLKPHQGWGNHSNHVIRCHYGLIVPDNCYITVNNIRVNHKNNQWIIFDDSIEHMAGNESDEDRIVLIIDIQRPKWIEVGTSRIGDTKELQDIVTYFKQNNINT